MELHAQGWTQERIAEAVGLDRSVVGEIIRKARGENREAAETPTPTPATPPDLLTLDERRLPEDRVGAEG